MRWRVLLIAVSVVALLAAGCGDDGDEAADSTTTVAQESTTTAGETTTTAEAATTSSQEPSAETSQATIEVLEEEDPGGMGPFTVSGAAADDGIVCDAGDAMIVQLFDADTGEPPPWDPEPTSLLVDWEFTCEDGSGTFTLQLTQPAHTEEDLARFMAGAGTGEIIDEGSTWETQSGTDAYATLQGEGTLTFEILDPSGRPSQATWVGTLSTG